jgi:hypothetical protein
MTAPNSQASTPLQNLSANQALRLIGSAKSVSMNAVADTVIPTINTAKYSALYVIVTNASASLAQAVAGLYTGPAAGGTTLVTAAALSACSGSTVVNQMTVASTAVATSQNLYFRVTTVNTAAATADVYVYGFAFD